MMPKNPMDNKQLNFNQPLLSVRRGSSTANPPPPLPPLPYYKSELKSGPVRNPGVVPFRWEQIPGRPKDERKLQNEAHNAREENGSLSSEGENSTYVDALDSLSCSESFFLNCSLTGVSGPLDDPRMKPDPLARDLMMDRFLPAAKAVASETPQFGSKKQPKEVMPLDKHNPRYYYTPVSLPQHSQEEEEEDTEEEEEEEDDYYGGNENSSAKLCGLLPRFCLLNPIPGMRDQVPRPITSVRKMHKKPANAGAYNKTDKAIRDAVYERKRLAVYKKSGMRIEAGRLKHELNELYPTANIAPENSRERQFLGIPEAAKPTREKTLYIDSAQMTEYRDSNSSSSESRSLTDSRGRNPSIDYSLNDIKDLCSADAEVQLFPKKDDKETAIDKSPVPLPLPLPKSPSESWLSRALPSVSSRNQRSYLSTGNLGFRSSPVDPKWEANRNFGLPALTPISEN